MKIFLRVLIALLSFPTFSQTKLEIVKKQSDTAILEGKYHLLLISHSNCGHCLIAMKELQTLENVEVVVINYGADEKRKQLEQQYPYVFLNGEEIKGLERPEFFPKLFLYKNNELIWKKKGWFSKNLEKIKSKIERG